jgi:hypothetical protein
MKKTIVKKHLLVLLAGFLHAMKGTLATALLCGVGVAFGNVQRVSGYWAVGMFAAALLALCAAIWLFYLCGRDMLYGRYSK